MDKHKLTSYFNFRWSAIAVAFMISVVPLVIFPKVIEITSDYVAYYWTSTPQVDMFSYYKGAAVILFAILGGAAFLADVYFKKVTVKRSPYYIPMGVYVLFAMLSTLFSTNKEIAFFGFVGRYEGILVLLSYMVILFMAINVGGEKKYTLTFIILLAVSSSLIGILGILQHFNVGQANFVPSFEGIYSTFGNSNYMGSYMSMLFPLSLALFISAGRTSHRILGGLFNCIMFANWIGCNSLAGIAGGTFGALMVLIIYRSDIVKGRYMMYIVLLYLIIFWGMRGFSLCHIPEKVFVAPEPSAVIPRGRQTLQLEGVSINKESITLNFSKGHHEIKIDDINRFFEVNDGNNMPFIYDMGKVRFPWGEPRDLHIIVFKSDDSRVVEEAAYGPMFGRTVRLNFALGEGGFKFINHRDEVVDLEQAEAWGFEGMERVGSGRGYIWSRSIPLLKETVILGYGPDTFAMHFPQHDYIGKLLNYATINEFVDKPHSMYLNAALNTGIPSLLSLIVIFIIYFTRNLELCFKINCRDEIFHLRTALFTALLGYMVSGLFNDSVVSVAPVFWALLGLGIGIDGTFLNNTRLNS